MLENISKLLTGDMLKILCDMGHGDEIVFADNNFPAETYAQRLVRCPGVSVTELYEAINELFPLDVDYNKNSAFVMDITDEDKAKGMTSSASWEDYERTLHIRYPNESLCKLERDEFYKRTKNAYAVFQTGDVRAYANLLLIKGCVL